MCLVLIKMDVLLGCCYIHFCDIYIYIYIYIYNCVCVCMCVCVCVCSESNCVLSERI